MHIIVTYGNSPTLRNIRKLEVAAFFALLAFKPLKVCIAEAFTAWHLSDGIAR